MPGNRAARLVASGLGSGHLPAPGTAGSLAALLPGAALLHAGPGWLLAGIILACLAGFWAIPRAGGTDDPGWVVIDEVAGQWLTLLGLRHVSWPGLLLGFALFRLLDIAKPGPIGWADRRHGAVGVMMDDILAGAIGGIVLLGLRWGWPWLLTRTGFGIG